MEYQPRVLDTEPVTSLSDYERIGGGEGLRTAHERGRAYVFDVLDASGLRGRGGAGFPTGRKWRTVAEHLTEKLPPTVVVNAAEGEPGSFKDRAIIRANPYRLLEGALIAAHTLGADTAVIASKDRFEKENRRLEEAIEELRAAGWCGDVAIDLVRGPEAYLYGEETALLEVVAGRDPFPRVAPPWRQGIDAPEADPGADTDSLDDEPPVLVNNVETLANVAGIVARGADWFRELGTAGSPGTVVCTITGQANRDAVAEIPLGTTLREAIEVVGGGMPEGREVSAVLSGVANALITPAQLGTPITHDDLKGIGSGIGTAGFVVFDDTTDPVAVAAGVSRFLSVESCGQCTPCKADGRLITEKLTAMAANTAGSNDAEELGRALETVTDSARCFLANQHQNVVNSLLAGFPAAAERHTDGTAAPVEPVLIAEIEDLVPGERCVLDERHARKQPDWTYDAVDSGKSPVDRLRPPGG